MTDEPPVTYFESPEDLRSWLEANHATATELWVGYWKKHSGRNGLTWSEAVDQALCFGWIDSVRYRVDDERSRLRGTAGRVT